MRRLKRKERTTTPAEPDTPQLPAVNAGFLATLGAYEDHDAIKFQSDTDSEWRFVRFYSQKANNAVDVVSTLGKQIREGHPYVAGNETIHSVAGLRFAVLAEFPHWVALGEDYAPAAAWLEPQPFGSKWNGEKVKEGFVALLLFFPDTSEVPEELEPAFVALAEVRGTKAPFVKDYLKAVKKTTTPEGAKALGQVASAVPPRFRVLGQFDMVPKTTGKFSYALAKCHTAPATVAQLEALSEWAGDEQAQADLESLRQLYDRKVDELKVLAAETE